MNGQTDMNTAECFGEVFSSSGVSDLTTASGFTWIGIEQVEDGLGMRQC